MAMMLLGALVAYLVGAIPVGLIVARLTGGVDIRRQGSGNIGATNVLRTLGKLPALATLLGDVTKGFVAVRIAQALGGDATAAAVGTVAAIVGNCWSIFLSGRGGRGVATGLGAFLSLAPWATAPAALVWLVVTATFRYVSLASVTACLCLPIGIAMLGYPWSAVVAAVVAALIVVYRHRENLERLLAGTERRLGERASPP